jgi:Imelysin
VPESGSGIADEVAGSSTDNPLVTDAVAEYQSWVAEQVDLTIAATETFTDAVRAGDLEGAKAAYAPSRQGWERIEPIAGLVGEIDGAVDARVDDFEGVDDPAFTGWHRLEYLLWEQGTTARGAASSGCSWSSGTAPACPNRSRSSAAARSPVHRWAVRPRRMYPTTRTMPPGR